MILNELLVTVAYINTTGLGCAARVHTPYCLMCRIILFLLSVCLRSLDNFYHWKVWLTIQESGLDHPLLRIPDAWTKAWFVFTCIGTALAILYIANELSGVISFYRQYKEKITDDITCLPCNAGGLNYITRTEILTLISVTLEDLPLLTLSLLFAAAQYSCNQPTPRENLSVLNAVFITSLSSLLHVGWSLLRFLLHLFLRACSNYCRARTKSPATADKTTEDLKVKMKEKELEIELESERRTSPNHLYPEKCCKMKWCIVCHSLTLAIVCGLTITLSLTAIGLTQHQDTLTNSFPLDPSQQLSVYRSFPEEQPIANVSTIIDSSMGICINEKFTDEKNNTISCDVVLSYSESDGLIYFDYADSNHNTSGTANTTVEKCAVYYEGMFLGHYAEAGVRRFHETCLSVLILPDNDELLQEQETLIVNCSLL